jgi:DNA-binding PucR family transcriptional regulator
LRAAVGRSAAGIGGFRQSHRQAFAAQRIAASLDRPDPLTDYTKIELIAVAASDAIAARGLVADQLGELAGPDRAVSVLRSTLLAYLESGGNAAAAARALGVHENTVHYRLRHAEEVLGRPLRPGDLKLQTALVLAETLGADLSRLRDR